MAATNGRTRASKPPRGAPARRGAPAPRWHRRKEARPAEIIAAALESFTEHGYTATKLEDVARRAGVTKGTMYLYFESKEALFKATVRETVVPAIERGEQTIENFRGNTRDLLATFFRGWWGAVAGPGSRMGGLPKLMISEVANFPELAKFYHREVVQRGRRLTARILERGIERREFRGVDVDYAVRVIMAPLILGAIWKHSMQRCESGPLDFERYIGTTIDLALNGLARPARKEGARA